MFNKSRRTKSLYVLPNLPIKRKIAFWVFNLSHYLRKESYHCAQEQHSNADQFYCRSVAEVLRATVHFAHVVTIYLALRLLTSTRRLASSLECFFSYTGGLDVSLSASIETKIFIALNMFHFLVTVFK